MTGRSFMARGRVALATLIIAAAAIVHAAETKPLAVVVGLKLDAEQAVLAELTVQLLQSREIAVEKSEPMGSAIVRKAQETGRVDLYWEDTVTSLRIYNKIEDMLPPDELYRTVRELDAEKGIVWLSPSAVSYTNALAMRGADATELGLSKLSDLAKIVNDGANLTLATSVEFSMRPDGLKPVEKAYGFRFARENVLPMDPAETYEALKNEEADVALVSTRDARVADYEFFVFEDDKDVFPTQVLAPVIRRQVLAETPGLERALNDLAALLDNQTMRRLSVQVEVEKKPIEDVARAFLREQDLM
jgi:osmoprotectant transport system substrate-binding protein